MTSMDYDDAAAERLEAVYRGADVVAQREETIKRLGLKPGEHVLDIGSGPGFLCQTMAEIVGPNGRVQGVDLSIHMVTRANSRNSLEWLSFSQGDATSLNDSDHSYDVFVSTQVAEYVPDINRFCTESFRVLKPDGRGLILATDWDMLAWHSNYPERMKRVLDAFKPHCADTILPRTLGSRLCEAGFDLINVSAYPIVNIDWKDDNYSTKSAPFISEYIRSKGTLPESELTAWEAELEELATRGQYYFVSNRIIFEVRRPS